jgi:hypothetical protein
MPTLNETERSNRSERPMTRAEFCATENISLTTYFKIKKAGHGPTEEHLPGTTIARITSGAKDGE